MPDLDGKDQRHAEMVFHEWVAKFWVHRPGVPVEESDLRRVDLAALRRQFRQEFNLEMWRDMSRDAGLTLEELWLSEQIMRREPLVLIVNADVSHGELAGVRHVIWPSRLLIGVLHEYTGALIYPTITATVDLGDTGHAILLAGVDRATGWFRYLDDWPNEYPGKVRSLLCAENNSVGVSATLDPNRGVKHPGASNYWLVPPGEMAKALGTVLEPTAGLRGLQNELLTKLFASRGLQPGVAGMMVQLPSFDEIDPLELAQLYGHPDAIGEQRGPASPGADAFERGMRLWDSADFNGARTAFEQAIAEGDTDSAAMGALWMGRLLMASDPESAKHFCRMAIDSRHTGQASEAALMLGLQLRRQGDQIAAVRHFEIAAHYRHPDASAWPAMLCGDWYVGQKNYYAASHFYQIATECSGDVRLMHDAWKRLAQTLEEVGDAEGSTRALRRADLHG